MEPPRVDVLIIATSGRFSADAVQYLERHNQSEAALRIEMWPSRPPRTTACGAPRAHWRVQPESVTIVPTRHPAG